jgi:crotonobetainyl-CoA:carnitine CoA-transferase CaiB-like acyl-CoA transferase
MASNGFVAAGLSGIRVLDVRRLAAGPYRPQTLAWFGAEVVKARGLRRHAQEFRLRRDRTAGAGRRAPPRVGPTPE